ncbi:hypothetical protein BVG19_g2998 [[Candida] boidinii]|nr:hypothetical protein BVG19_g2998 [[Candida] boidinii]OWB51981.1 hypothetical protein B5S27_g3552 [[Candida] boidinii]
MSFKGFQKAVLRAPQNLRQKFNMGEITDDPVYTDAERRFKELEETTKRLSDESKRYHKAVNDMLDHQIGFSKGIEEIFKPISGKVSDPNSTIPEGNPEGIEACEQYRAVVQELKETLKPDLELIETRIVGPSQELLKIIQSIRKMATKRDHKKLDLDRHQNTLKKAQAKVGKEKSTVKYEERVYKAENEVAIAQEEFDYYNEMLKTDLPVLFQLEGEFIKPLFVSLYYMQLNVFYTLSSKMEEMKIPYFDLNSDILEAYRAKKGDVEERADAIGVTHFKLGHARNKLEQTRRRFANQNGAAGAEGAASPYGESDSASSGYGASAYGQAPAYGQSPTYGQAPGYGQAATGYGQPGVAPAYGQTPPASTYGADVKQPYGADVKQPYGSPVAAAAPAYSPQGYVSPPTTSTYGAPAPAPVPAAAAAPGQETCTALYDYAAQAAGDLTFKAGDIITIVQRTPDANGWWTGSLNGAQGVFPGNYVNVNP